MGIGFHVVEEADDKFLQVEMAKMIASVADRRSLLGVSHVQSFKRTLKNFSP